MGDPPGIPDDEHLNFEDPLSWCNATIWDCLIAGCSQSEGTGEGGGWSGWVVEVPPVGRVVDQRAERLLGAVLWRAEGEGGQGTGGGGAGFR